MKAKPQALIQAAYSDDARAAGIEGRVRVQITIDASGAVVDTKLVSGLGHGLDEAALASLRRPEMASAPSSSAHLWAAVERSKNTKRYRKTVAVAALDRFAELRAASDPARGPP